MQFLFCRIVFFCVLSIMFSSCFTASYSPYVSLDVSPTTIKRSLLIEKFIDETDESERKKFIIGCSFTNPNSFTSSLATEVTNTIAVDFSSKSVFSSVYLKNEDAAYIMKGKIKKYCSKVRPTVFAYSSLPTLGFTLIGLLCGIPAAVAKVDIEIELSVYNRNKQLIATYTAAADIKKHYNIYHDRYLETPKLTNKTLKEVVLDLRNQILKDEKKFL